MRWKPILFFLIVGVLAVLSIKYVGTPLVRPGDVAPDFTIKDRDGNEVRLSDLRGNLVFLNFWATWCPPCVKEMPEMELMNAAFRDRPFKMLAISVDTNWDLVSGFYEQHRLSLPSYLDPGRRVANAYNVRRFPETYVIDANGIVLRHYIGEEQWASPQMLTTFDQMIRDQETAQSVSSQ